MKRVKTMTDGTTAVLTASKRYYVRYTNKGEEFDIALEPKRRYDRIEYYSLRGRYIPLASIECKYCGEIIQSQMCGHYVRCKCGMTACDTDRWLPERHRYLTK